VHSPESEDDLNRVFALRLSIENALPLR